MNEIIGKIFAGIIVLIIIVFGVMNMFGTSKCDVVNEKKVCVQKSGVSMFIDWVTQ